ncbi:MAG: sulfite exporter TauE/SafE family protein [Synergistaceae bacterium]|jgi:sulfite exporter TauE/SafE/copper chaperone CopZ|nr:sulfite exporter TauE/SafE family protein [Synergistaceae bacterium]
MAQKKLRTEVLRIGGMTCAGCENRIERGLKKLEGVSEVRASYGLGTASVVFDGSVTSLGKITSAIEGLDYEVLGVGSPGGDDSDPRSLIGAVLIVFALYVFLNHSGGGGLLAGITGFFPQAERGMGYGMLFVVGLLTSMHCVAMCGGINLSQCLGGCEIGSCGTKPLSSSLRPSLLYNGGRIVSYTIVGGIVGALGSVVSFSGGTKGIVQIAAGVFMVVIGVNMLGAFSFLRGLAPRMPRFITNRVEGWKSGRGPLYVGLLNGLMPCGPLQAMQLYALSTGSPLEGALSMFVFSLGTAPLMFALGAFGAMMSKRFSGVVTRVGAALVIVMGVAMFNNGASLSGFGDSVASAAAGPEVSLQGVASGGESTGEVQTVTTQVSRYGYQPITVKAGVPVRWTIKAPQGSINGCNNAIVIPAFRIEKRLAVGDNVIEFTPLKAGVYRYSCWMGMIRSTITVTDGDVPAPNASIGGGSGAAEAAEEPGEYGYDLDEPPSGGGCSAMGQSYPDEGGFSEDEPSRPSYGGTGRRGRAGCCSRF